MLDHAATQKCVVCANFMYQCMTHSSCKCHTQIEPKQQQHTFNAWGSNLVVDGNFLAWAVASDACAAAGKVTPSFVSRAFIISPADAVAAAAAGGGTGAGTCIAAGGASEGMAEACMPSAGFSMEVCCVGADMTCCMPT